MKDVLKNRVKRLEEILKGEDNLCMIAKQDKDGFHWNGVTLCQSKRIVGGCSFDRGQLPGSSLADYIKASCRSGG